MKPSKEIKKVKDLYNITEWNDYRLNYWGIPKCGHSALKASFLNYPVEHKSQNIPAVHSPFSVKYIDQQIAKSNGNLNFAVLRHPVKRVLSLYKHFGIRGPEGSKKVFGIEDYSDVANFDIFLDLLCNTDNTFKSNHHVRSSSTYLCKENTILVDMYFDLDSDIVQLKKFLKDKKIDLKQVNTTNHLDLKLKPKHYEKIYNRYKDDFLNFGYKI